MPDLYGHLTPQGVLNGSLQTIVHADNYNDLTNKPSINSVELQGNKTAADLGLLTAGDIPVDSVNGKQGVVILDGDDIEYEPGTSVNSKITDLEAEIGSGPVVSVNGQQGVVELDGTDIKYSLSKTLNQKIDEVEASIPVVSYPVTSVNTKTGAVVLDGDDIDYAEGVTVNDQIGTNTADIGDLSQLTTSVTSSLVGAVNEVNKLETVSISTSGAICNLYQSNASKQNKLVVVNLNLALTSATSLYALLCTMSKKPISEIQIFLHSSSDNGFYECHLGADGTILWWNSAVIPSNTNLIGQFVYFTND